jgi:UDP-N-acetylglucosamine 2-epimerase (non-hydrolysing)
MRDNFPQLHCILGTRAQIIKMAPIIKILEERGIQVNLILTGQHKHTVDALFADFGLCTQARHVYDGPEINGIGKMVLWLPKVIWRLWKHHREFFPGRSGIVIVHGDTVSTLAGALAGKLLGLKVAHVEAGLRSYNWLHPFPEELTRLAVFGLSDIAYCPGVWATENMRRYKCVRIDTKANTIVDAVRKVMSMQDDLARKATGRYGVISIHRFENIFREHRLRQIVRMLEYAASKSRLIFVLHPATEKRLQHTGLYSTLQSNPNIELRPRMGYAEFIRLIMRSDFVITDGGSNQEELSLTDIPVLLMRKATERQEGIGKNIVLGNYDENAFQEFIDHATTEAISDYSLQGLPTDSPSEMICTHLLSHVRN